METVEICVYRDTIEEHDEVNNLSYITVTKEFVQKYFNECGKDKYFDDLEDFLNEYIADDTEDFYEFAMKHNAVISIEHE